MKANKTTDTKNPLGRICPICGQHELLADIGYDLAPEAVG